MVPGLVLPAALIAGSWLVSLDPPPTHVDPALWVDAVGDELVLAGAHLPDLRPSSDLPRRTPALAAMAVARRARRSRWSRCSPDRWRPSSTGCSVLQNDQTVWRSRTPSGCSTARRLWSSGIVTLWSLGLLTVTWPASSRGHPLPTGHDPRRATSSSGPCWPSRSSASVSGIAAAAQGMSRRPSGSSCSWSPSRPSRSPSAIAVLRYRLYEIDRIISRTIGWALVTGVAGGRVRRRRSSGLQTALASVTQGQTLAVAASTLVAFALFQPRPPPRPAGRRPALRPGALRRRADGRRLRRAPARRGRPRRPSTRT